MKKCEALAVSPSQSIRVALILRVEDPTGGNPVGSKALGLAV